MGLDQFARTRRTAPENPVDFDSDGEELHYWRKHPNLHGWMETLYRDKGGAREEFNVTPVALTAEDLDRLEADIEAGDLPSTSGFFFGESDGSETPDDLDFIRKARERIAAGDTVFYTSWW